MLDACWGRRRGCHSPRKRAEAPGAAGARGRAAPARLQGNKRSHLTWRWQRQHRGAARTATLQRSAPPPPPHLAGSRGSRSEVRAECLAAGTGGVLLLMTSWPSGMGAGDLGAECAGRPAAGPLFACLVLQGLPLDCKVTELSHVSNTARCTACERAGPHRLHKASAQAAEQDRRNKQGFASCSARQLQFQNGSRCKKCRHAADVMKAVASCICLAYLACAGSTSAAAGERHATTRAGADQASTAAVLHSSLRLAVPLACIHCRSEPEV